MGKGFYHQKKVWERDFVEYMYKMGYILIHIAHRNRGLPTC